MCDGGVLLLADTIGVLTAVYWACLVIGGGLLVISSLGGGDSDVDVDVDAGGGLDLDADADFDMDVGADADLDVDTDVAHATHAVQGGTAALTTWFSMRFVVFFVAIFGAIGVILTHLTPTGTWMILTLALIAGAIVGQGAHHTFRYLRRTSGDSSPRPQDYVNKLARVTIAVEHPNKGEVALQVRNARRFVPALGHGSEGDFAIGDEVVVVGYRAGVARIVSRQEFERRTRRS